MANKR